MDIGDARYVSITTFRRDGEGVATPVWIAPLGDGRVGFTTDVASGKAKRIGNRPDVTLQECSMRGEVAAGTAEVHGTAEVVTDGPDHDAAVAAIRRKYGIQFRLVELGGRLKRLVGRSKEPAAAVVITLR
ncbi:MAG: PPOX class F420-dependent oxidoreductase [Acidimicrobiales bacterium]|nr:PPOX class F420-dependent oxidoreductase [Acidimicrobiales bacterium]HRW38130.1 PPOX class F420-dependent oxidoreductase [Aquihabitans sp.]